MSARKSAIILLLILSALASISSGALAAKPGLAFRADGSFKIIHFTDPQDGPNLDSRTTAGMNKILDSEKPDFVVITGDCVDTNLCSTQGELKTAIDKVIQPMETRGIPWAITFGNHDRDNLGKIGISQDAMLRLYMKYPHNINRESPRGVYGAGNANILVGSSATGEPSFGIWLIDSNAYAPDEINHQKIKSYDWIHSSQVKWYQDTSIALEKRWGKKIPSLMFFHIPLPEFQELMKTENFVGEKNEGCACPSMNSGLFVTAMERGDVKGIFVGHDHVNTLVGDWYGIKLGYSGSIGHRSYGLNGKTEEERNRLRGARLFIVHEAGPSSFETRYITADSLK